MDFYKAYFPHFPILLLEHSYFYYRFIYRKCFLLIYGKAILLPKLVMDIIDVMYLRFGNGLMLFLKYILLIAKMPFTGTYTRFQFLTLFDAASEMVASAWTLCGLQKTLFAKDLVKQKGCLNGICYGVFSLFLLLLANSQ